MGVKGKTDVNSKQLTLTAVGDVFLPGTVRFVNGKLVSSEKKS